jgi:hypothetical protein
MDICIVCKTKDYCSLPKSVTECSVTECTGYVEDKMDCPHEFQIKTTEKTVVCLSCHKVLLPAK